MPIDLSFTDHEDPQIICVEDFVKQTDDCLATAKVAWTTPNATDNSGNVSNVICNPRQGSEFPIGYTMVTCETFDGSGNKAMCTFYVNVTGNYTSTCIYNMCVFSSTV